VSGLLSIGFANPLVLAGLISLPVIWWLLRFTPPRPRRQVFPPTRLLLDLVRKDETPAKSPLWLTLLRMAIAALVILALAGPILNPRETSVSAEGPLVLVLENGWASSPGFDNMRATAETLIDDAASSGQTIIFTETSPMASTPAVGPFDRDQARERLSAVAAVPYAAGGTDEVAILMDRVGEALGGQDAGTVALLSHGLAWPGATTLRNALADLPASDPMTIYTPPLDALPNIIDPPRSTATALQVTLRAPDAASARPGLVRAYDLKGGLIAEQDLTFAPSERAVTAEIALPVDLRNDIARLELVGEGHAASVYLLDDRWRRRAVGLVSGETRERAQPLLAPLYYLRRAAQPFATLMEPRAGTLEENIAELVDNRASVIALADIGALRGSADTLERWVGTGGILVRFAGPRLAASADDLIPVELRRGERSLGGTLSWSEPQTIAPFSENSPFSGVPISDEVTVSRQVLAEPSADIADRVWARLSDGTPLVTAAPRGQGWIVLFHVTADAAWSNLPLSGTFVEMLRRLVALSSTQSAAAASSGGGQTSADAAAQGTAASTETPLRPFRVLDGEGRLAAPTPFAEPLMASAFATTMPDRSHPPGLYGSEDGFRALNLAPGDALTVAPAAAEGVSTSVYATGEPTRLGPHLLVAALILLLIDALAIMIMTGRRPTLKPAEGALAIAFTTGAVLALASAPSAYAQSSTMRERAPTAIADEATQFALEAANATRIAFVETGNTRLDRITRAGLTGLSRALSQRTALEPASPVGISLESDELAFFPLIYWAIDPSLTPPSEAALARLDSYMKNGGTVLFDTRDAASADTSLSSSGAGMSWLRRVLGTLDLPPLEPIPSDHVVTKTFYLLQEFPGRFEGGRLWLESRGRLDQNGTRPFSNADGVSTIIITSNDMAGAWAVDDAGQFILPMSSGTEWQREIALRAGINIVMYTMTGNYKADQVHIPALLERLGQ
jgi:hypothetical protein